MEFFIESKRLTSRILSRVKEQVRVTSGMKVVKREMQCVCSCFCSCEFQLLSADRILVVKIVSNDRYIVAKGEE